MSGKGMGKGMVKMGIGRGERVESEMDHLRPLLAAGAVYKCKPTQSREGEQPFESYSRKSGHGPRLSTNVDKCLYYNVYRGKFTIGYRIQKKVTESETLFIVIR